METGKQKYNTKITATTAPTHFMLKEIYEQPNVLQCTITDRLDKKKKIVVFNELDVFAHRIRAAQRVIIIGCGTALHAGQTATYFFEENSFVRAEAVAASEFEYKVAALNKENDIVVAVSQSGETFDTLAALAHARQSGLLTIGITNVADSTLAKKADATIYNNAGKEISIASTKVFTSQLLLLTLFALYIKQLKNISNLGYDIIESIENLPAHANTVISQNESIKNIAQNYYHLHSMYYLGRKQFYPIAREGALKLKETAYIHAEGMPAGELRHGPLAFIDENILSVCLCLYDSQYEKNIITMKAVNGAGGRLFAVATADDNKVRNIAQNVAYIPKTNEWISSILAVIPLQLFAYYIAAYKGTDLDNPRNLNKSVTIE